MNGSHTVNDYEVLEIEIIREAWNTYDLEDGTRLKARSVLMKVLWPKGLEIEKGDDVEVQMGANINTLVVVFAPERLRGPQNPRPPSVRAARKLPKEEVEVVDSKEEWSIYRIPKPPGGLKTRMVVTSVFRVTDVYNQDGDPYYIVNSSVVMGPTTPREIPP